MAVTDSAWRLGNNFTRTYTGMWVPAVRERGTYRPVFNTPKLRALACGAATHGKLAALVCTAAARTHRPSGTSWASL